MNNISLISVANKPHWPKHAVPEESEFSYVTETTLATLLSSPLSSCSQDADAAGTDAVVKGIVAMETVLLPDNSAVEFRQLSARVHLIGGANI